MAMPAVILVLVGCLAAGQLSTQQLRLQDAASTAVRSVSRGVGVDTVGRQARQAVPGASVSRSDRGGLVCVTVTLPASRVAGILAAVTLSASGCALAESH